jgi:6-pyruvoyltetrahydropterin/6-carboxytetrahydropterin synthase
MLNDVPGLDKPSLENLCLFVWNALQPRFPRLARVTVKRESIGQSCTYTGR